MGEKKETQWLVGREGPVPKTLMIEPTPRWFDSREAAREHAQGKNARARKHKYRVVPMKRGPRS